MARVRNACRKRFKLRGSAEGFGAGLEGFSTAYHDEQRNANFGLQSESSLNLALSSAKRVWSTIHMGELAAKMDEAHNTLFLAKKYMTDLGGEFEKLSKIKMSDNKVKAYIEQLFPLDDSMTDIRKSNAHKLREDLTYRYTNAPDLNHVGKNAYRFVCAVSDFATHAKPLREIPCGEVRGVQ